MLNFRDFTGKEVTITASGMTYTGKVIEVNENCIILKASAGYREIPMDSVNKVDEIGAAAQCRLGSGLPPSPLAGLPPKK